MRTEHLVSVIVCSVALCSTVWGSTVSEMNRQQWRADVLSAGLSPEIVIDPFQVSPEMELWAAEVIEARGARTAEEMLEALQAALFDEERFDFTYGEDVTLTAREAFERRHGNCLSFTSLFVALARSQDIQVSLVSVQKIPDYQRADDLVVVNRHVVAGYRTPTSWILFDFYRTTTAPYVHQRTIPDVQASAMVHANLGGMALRIDDPEEAMRHLELSVQLAPDWAPAWVNLGVAHLRTGDVDQAFAAYSRALSLEPTNGSALTNMAVIYRDQGRIAEARAALAAAARRSRNPFTLIALADMEMANGNVGQARAHLRRAKWWFKDEPAVYEAFSRLEMSQGNQTEARRAMIRAERLRSEAEETASD